MKKLLNKLSFLPVLMVLFVGATVSSDGTITLDSSTVTGTNAVITKIGASLLTMVEQFRPQLLGLAFVLGIIGFINRKLG